MTDFGAEYNRLMKLDQSSLAWCEQVADYCRLTEAAGELRLALKAKSREVSRASWVGAPQEYVRVATAEFIRLYDASRGKIQADDWTRYYCASAAHSIALEALGLVDATWDEAEIYAQFFEKVIADNGFSTHQPLVVRIQMCTSRNHYDRAKELAEKLIWMMPHLLDDKREAPHAYTGCLTCDHFVMVMAEGPAATVERAEALLAPVFAGGPIPQDCAKARANGHAMIARFLLRDGELAAAKDRYERAAAAAHETDATIPRIATLEAELAMADPEPVRLREVCATLRASADETDHPYGRWQTLRRLVCALRILGDAESDADAKTEAAARARDLDELSVRLDRRETPAIYVTDAAASATLQGLLAT